MEMRPQYSHPSSRLYTVPALCVTRTSSLVYAFFVSAELLHSQLRVGYVTLYGDWLLPPLACVISATTLVSVRPLCWRVVDDNGKHPSARDLSSVCAQYPWRRPILIPPCTCRFGHCLPPQPKFLLLSIRHYRIDETLQRNSETT